MWKRKPKGSSKTESYITFEADVTQIKQLLTDGIITPEIAEAGLQAGVLRVKVAFSVYQAFLETSPLQNTATVTNHDLMVNSPKEKISQADQQLLEQIAQKIHQNKLDSAARLFLTANRPMSFVGSQILVGAQPFSHMLFGADAVKWLSQYGALLENRHNLDWLMARLDQLRMA